MKYRYAFSQIHSLSLPIPQALGIFTVVLPLITGISTRGANGLIKRAVGKEQEQLTIPLIGVIGFQLIYETIVATLSLTYILPPSFLDCALNEKWQQFYVVRNAKAIRDIQNAFECCGYRTVKDRAWPFTEHTASPCSSTLDRTKSCAGDWRKATQVTAGLFLLVAVVVFIVKVFRVRPRELFDLTMYRCWLSYCFSLISLNGRAGLREKIESIEQKAGGIRD